MNSEFIKKMVSDRQVDDNRCSVFVTVLQDARINNGRDRETGILKNGVLYNDREEIEKQPGYSFIDLINYLVILEMLGSVFKKTSARMKKPDNENSITYLLEQFAPQLCAENRDTIKALRNCLAHNYSLLNMPHDKKKDKNELHAFTICWEQQSSLITYPGLGNRLARIDVFSEKQYFTEICAKSLTDLVENVFQQIKEGVNNGSVESYKSDDEVKSRFTYSFN